MRRGFFILFHLVARVLFSCFHVRLHVTSFGQLRVIEKTNSELNVMSSRFTGCVVDWRGTYGFVSCHHLPRKVFLHHSVIEGWDPEKEMPLGSSLKFTVEYDPVRSSYKALEAQLFA